jgi:hypothetical protein
MPSLPSRDAADTRSDLNRTNSCPFSSYRIIAEYALTIRNAGSCPVD